MSNTIDHNTEANRIEVRGAFDDRFLIKGADPSRRWDPKAKVWWFPASQMIAVNVAKTCLLYTSDAADE